MSNLELSTTDLALLVNELSEVTDPHQLGINLGINPAKVTILLKNVSSDIKRQKSDILEEWLKNDVDASWHTLVKTLRKINHVKLADKLEKKYGKGGVGTETKELKREPEEDDFQGKRAEIRKSEKAVKIEYGRFLYRAGKLMEKRRVHLPDIKVTWSGYDSGMGRDACKATDIPSFLMAIRGNQGPYAYENIGGLLILFCDKEGEELVAEYEKKLKCQLHPRVMSVQRIGKRFKVKIDREFSQESKSGVLDFQNTLATLFECRTIDFILEDVHDGCIELLYVVPSELAEKLQNYCNLHVKQREFKDAKILELWLQTHLLWSSVQTQKRELKQALIDADESTVKKSKPLQTLFDKSMSSRSKFPIVGQLRSVSSTSGEQLSCWRHNHGTHRCGLVLVILGYFMILSGPFTLLIVNTGAQQVSQNSLTESTAQLGSHAARIGILPIIATITTTAGLVLCMTGSPLLGFRRQKECIIIHIIILVCLLAIFAFYTLY